jgi:TPR repeat protein
MCNRAQLCTHGYGCAKNPKRATELHKIAASKGHPYSILRLWASESLILTPYNNITGPEALTHAFQQILDLAEKGDYIQQLRAGHCLDTGLGTTIDHYKAFEFYKNAALQGHIGISRTKWSVQSYMKVR